MNDKQEVDMNEIHTKLAKQLFNSAWDLMEKEDRTAADDDTMIHTTHASRYHWEQIGEPVNLARGEWGVVFSEAIISPPKRLFILSTP